MILGHGRGILTILGSNVGWTNTDHRALGELIERTSPDLLVILEVSPSWRRFLERLSSYPHQLYSPELPWGEGTWGTAILSRRPWGAERLIPVTSHDRIERPVMEVTLDLGGEPLVVRGAHPNRPGRAWRNELRNAVIDTMARLDWSGNGLLLGDLNTTSTSPVFQGLLERTGLRDSRRGFGRQPTYATNVLIPGLEIAIDHVLVSDRIGVLERWTEELPGSDHRSVVVRVTRLPE